MLYTAPAPPISWGETAPCWTYVPAGGGSPQERGHVAVTQVRVLTLNLL